MSAEAFLQFIGQSAPFLLVAPNGTTYEIRPAGAAMPIPCQPNQAKAIPLARPASEAPALTNRQGINLYVAEKVLHAQAGGFSPKSLERAKYYLHSFADFRVNGARLGELPAGSGNSSDLTQWLAAHPGWAATATKSSAISQVLSCFRWLEAEGHCKNPYKRPKFLGHPMRPRPAFTPAEFAAMRQAVRTAKMPGKGLPRRTRWVFWAAMLFLWKTGCRTCEMRAARWDELDWERAIIELEKHKTAEATGQTRLIPVRRVLRLLRWLHARRKPGQEHIFGNSKRTPTAWTCGVFAREFRRFATLAGIRKSVSAYCLRHGLCVRQRGRLGFSLGFLGQGSGLWMQNGPFPWFSSTFRLGGLHHVQHFQGPQSSGGGAEPHRRGIRDGEPAVGKAADRRGSREASARG